VDAISKEIRFSLPRLVANLTISLVFVGMSYIVLWTLSSISTEIVFLLQVGFLLAAGIFLMRILFDALTIVDKATGLFVRILGIKEGWSRQRIFKDTIYIVAILLVTAAVFPIFSKLTNSGLLFQQISTYAALGLILLFVYDIGRTFSRITEKKANSVAKRFSNSSLDEKINGT